MRALLSQLFGCCFFCAVMFVQPLQAACVLDGDGVIDALPFELQKLLVAPAGDEKVCRLEPPYQPRLPEEDRVFLKYSCKVFRSISSPEESQKAAPA